MGTGTEINTGIGIGTSIYNPAFDTVTVNGTSTGSDTLITNGIGFDSDTVTVTSTCFVSDKSGSLVAVDSARQETLELGWAL